jgi:ABC-2 type transport system permease protein
MHNVLRIARKELSSFFSSLAAFIFLGVFLAVLLFIVFWLERFFARNIADIRPLFDWIPVLMIFLISAMTMRMWSEERRSGTLEFLMTTPATPLQLVLGKFLACFLLVAIALALTLPLPVTVWLVGPLDWGPVIGGNVAALALAAAYISIGLFVSSRTDNQVVSLIVTTLVCGIFYLLGSKALTMLFGNSGSEFLRLLGTGSRFESIARGVIDMRDIYYYLSIFGVFLVLNIYSLESLRWSAEGREKRHSQWRLAAVLFVANLVAANFWLGQLGWARADLTSGNIYSISDATRSYLRQLQEPLLIRGYFSAETHPLLAPLVPRLRDLLREYEIAGDNRVRVEIIDPLREPALEAEANQQYGIRPVPFQTASKYQAAVTNSYFDILVKYGDEYTTLGYRDLIEVKQQQESDLQVELRDPEYEITRAIKKVLGSYRGGGNVLTSIPGTVELTAYLSADQKLPEPMPGMKTHLQALIADYEKSSPGKFEAKFVDPERDGGGVFKQLQDTYGLRPLAVGLLDPQQFWFHIFLRSGDRIEQVPLPETLDKDGLKRNIDAALKRFTPGALRTVAFYAPPPNPMAQFGAPNSDTPSFQLLEQKLRETTAVESTNLDDGRVPEAADILLVAAPDALDEKQLFAIDQFLMKGGTVVLAAAPFKASLKGNLEVAPSPTGLEEWLAAYGLTLEKAMVLDPQNTPFPIPIERNVGGFNVRQVQLLDYPYFVDVRGSGLAREDAPTIGLDQLTVSWAAPIEIDDAKATGRKIVRLIESSPRSWKSDTLNAVPDFQAYPELGFPPGKETGPQLLGVVMEGEFKSLFAGKPSPLAKDATAGDKEKAEKAGEGATAEETGANAKTDEKPEKASITSVIERSPESARIILIGSSSALSDDILSLTSSVNQTQYLAPLTLVQNMVEWSLEDRGLLALRSRGGQFSRTLEPMTADIQALWEYFNYGLALLGLGIVYVLRQASRRLRQRRYQAMLGIEGA